MSIIGPDPYKGYDLGQNPTGQFAFKYSGDHYAFLGADGETFGGGGDNNFHALRSTDGGNTWEELDSGGVPIIPFNTAAASVLVDGDKVVLLYLNNTGFNVSSILGFSICTFNLLTSAWGAPASFTSPVPAAFAPDIIRIEGAVYFQIVRRDANDYLVCYSGPSETVTGTPYGRLYCVSLTFSGSWVFGSPVEIPGQTGVTQSFLFLSAICDSSRNTFFLYTNDGMSGTGTGPDLWAAGMNFSGAFGATSLITENCWWRATFSPFTVASPLALIPGAPQTLAFALPISTGITNPATGKDFSEFHLFSSPAALTLHWSDSIITSDAVTGYVCPGQEDYPTACSMGICCNSERLVVIWNNSPSGPDAPVRDGSGAFVFNFRWLVSSTSTSSPFSWTAPAVFAGAPDFSGGGGNGSAGSQVYVFESGGDIAAITQWTEQSLFDELAQFTVFSTLPGYMIWGDWDTDGQWICPVLVVGQQFLFFIQSTFSGPPVGNGFPLPVTVSVTAGSLPPGITFSGSKTLHGTPTVPGVFPLTLLMTNGVSSASAQFNLEVFAVEPPLRFFNRGGMVLISGQGTSTNLEIFDPGQEDPGIWTVASGTFPPGMSLNRSTGLLEGVAGTPGVYTSRVRCIRNDGSGDELTLYCSYTILPEQAAYMGPPPGLVGVPYAFQLSTDFADSVYLRTGFLPAGAPYTFTSDDGLPPGLALSSAGLISGTPTTIQTYFPEIFLNDGFTGFQVPLFVLGPDVPPEIVTLYAWVPNILDQTMPAFNLPPQFSSDPSSPPERRIIGVMDGTNPRFTLTTVGPVTTVMLCRNGDMLSSGFDYTLSGNVITFVPGSYPVSGDLLTAAVFAE